MSSSTPQFTKPPHSKRSRSPEDDETTRLTERAGVVIGITTGILGGLLAAGFAFLPVDTPTEKGWIFVACLALSVASVTGIGAWRNARRFALTATCMFVTVISLASLSVAAQDNHPIAVTSPTAANATSPGPTTSTSGRSETAASPLSSTSARPTASQVISSARTSQPTRQLLVNMSPIDPSLSNYSTGEQKVDGQVYQQTIYDETHDDQSCNDGVTADATGQVIYELDRKYTKFHVTVGLADTSASGDTITFKVLIDGQQRYASTSLTVGETQTINMSIKDAFRLTLQDVCTSKTEYTGGPTVTAVWVNPEVSD
jgi:hypothetical protein